MAYEEFVAFKGRHGLEVIDYLCDHESMMHHIGSVVQRTDPKFAIALENQLLNRWLQTHYKSQYHGAFFDLDFINIREFPLEYLADHIGRFTANCNYASWELLSHEIIKIIYKLWPVYMNSGALTKIAMNKYPHDAVRGAFVEIAHRLHSFRKYPLNELRLQYHAMYPHWNLFAFIPLLPDGLEILHMVCKLPYDDFRDNLMIGLICYDPADILDDLKDIIVYWDQNNISIQSKQMKTLIDNMYANTKYNFWNNSVYGPALTRITK
jgi:hypothetical protein